MRALMGVLRNEHGVYYVRKKVPKALEQAVAKSIGAKRTTVHSALVGLVAAGVVARAGDALVLRV